MKILLTEAGYLPNPVTGTWSKPGYSGINYSDGDQVEARIAAIIGGVADLSVFSVELSHRITDWPSLYHLSATRSNILRPFRALLEGANVLEIGAGCGAITRYLGECNANVLALEGTPRRAAVARTRTRDLLGVEVVADRFDDFRFGQQFDVITLIGVLEYANLFTEGPNPAVSMLARARALLKPAGKLIIAIENQLGLKYFAGAPEDHLGAPMYGIEARYRADQPQTYGRKVLSSLLKQAGFEDAEFLAPFPDYKLPVSIVTENGMTCEAFDAGALAWQSARRDPQLPHYLAFSPELVWPSLAQNGIALDLANSFLVLASNSAQDRSDPNVLAYHFSTDRVNAYCKETRFVRSTSGAIELQYYSLAPRPGRNDASALLKFSLPDKAVYRAGTVLSKELIDIVTRDGWRIEDVGAFLRRFLQIATALATAGREPLSIDSVATALPGICFDLVPQNIVVCADGRYYAIDREWELHEGICVGWLVFRTLLLLVQSVTRFGQTDSAFARTRIGFFAAAFHSAGLAATAEDINSYSKMEAKVQAEVVPRPIEQLANWWSDSELPFYDLNQKLVEREEQVASLTKALVERDGQIAGLTKALVEREEQVASLTKALVERDGQIAGLTKALVEREGQVASLTKELVGRGGQIASLTKALVERDGQIASLTNALVEREGQIAASFTSSYSWRLTAPLRGFRSVLRKGALRLRRIQANLLERKFSMDGFFDAEFYLKEYPDVANARIDPLHHYLEYGWREGRDPSSSFSTLLYLNNNPDVAYANMNPLLHYLHHGRIEGRMPFSRLIAESVSVPDEVPPVAGSTIQSDEMGGYFDAEFYLKEYPDVANAKIDPLHHYLEYGWWEGRDPSPSFSTLLYLNNNPDVAIANMNPLLHYLHHGRIEGRMPFSRLKAEAESVPNQVPPVAGSTEVRHGDFLIPLYLNPFRPELTSGNPQIENVLICSIANDSQSYLSLLEALGNIPCKIDLQISVSDPAKIVHPSSQSRLDGRLRSLSFRDGSSDRSSLHALLAMLAKEVGHPYDVIGFFDATGGTLKSCAASASSLLEAPLFSQTGVSEIMDTLAGDARIIVPALNWREHLRNAGALDASLVNNVPDATLLGNATLAEHICECKSLWINGRSISVISQETWADALAETSVSDSAIAVAEELAKIIKQCRGRDYVLFGAATNPPDPAYEEQIDYSGSIQSHAVKVLAFYLPQFNPTPENDEWHGEGFTEWNKVRAANPLFEGHYQQHVPHPDLGYYKLDSTEVLKKQVEMMKKAGVHGQIFYHYWFGGRLILEKAAQMLLADKTVELPFCFCWANENWTRRWDGDEQEILLGQNYSPDDAAGFIRYLIPFFRDERYILIDGRPVLYIYRPSSIEHLAQYCTIWRDICREEGISEPFLVATLTRGAISPHEFGMDAGCERVLHDWTGGALCERRDEIVAYRPVEGAVLNYDDVANFYMTHSDEKDFIYFRSIVPIWDNTARYESRAYVVNSCSPEKFQEWLESLVLDATKRLKSSERFVVINAWNEWAEGAHLEPDCRFGYAYLNSIGRTLSGFQYSKREYLNYKISESTTLKLNISTDFIKRLTLDEWAKSKFLKCLENSSIWGDLQVFIDVEVLEIMPSLSEVACTETIATQFDYELIINDFCLFPHEAIANMVKMAVFHGGCSITPTHVNDPKFSHMETRWNTTTEVSRYLYVRGFGSPVLKYCVDAEIFISEIDNTRILSPMVTTILRFHRNGSLKLLTRALYSLAAQIDCRVRPIIAAQDLTPAMSLTLDQVLEQIPWANDCRPMVRHYKSSDSIRDLRSLMLNDALSQISEGYVTFLDYDDIVYHDAYAWLANRLGVTGKNATFGRVYSTSYNPETCRIGDKAEVFKYGAGYKCFVESNHAPIHSFMINIDKIEANNIEYYPDMKYMEDYFLTLQIFSEGGTDWESLNENKFVGEYYHQAGEDSPNTLALIDVEKKKSLLSDPYYLRCERRIVKLRYGIMNKAQSDLPAMTFTWPNRR